MNSPSEIETHRDWLPDLFAFLSTKLAPHVSALLRKPWKGSRAFEARFVIEELRASDDGRASTNVLGYLRTENPPGWICEVTNMVERYLVVAQCIDSLFELIHPRVPQGFVRTPRCLQKFRDYRLQWGWYGKTALGTVLPKGPLRPHDSLAVLETPAAGGGDVLDDQFGFLCLLPELRSEQRYTIDVRILGAFEACEMPIGTAMNDLKIGFAPLAEGADDLTFSYVVREGKDYITVVPFSEEVLAERASKAIGELAKLGVRIVVFPEWCLTEKIIQRISKKLARLNESGSNPIELVVAGTHLAKNASEMSFSECLILNSAGKELWRQRKLHHWVMKDPKAMSIGLPPTERGGYTEDIETDDCLVVRDIPTVGRIVILICEDLVQDVPSLRACRKLRPDWVFCPILDHSIKPQRWVHGGGDFVARRYGARVVVANSMTMEVRRQDRTSPEKRTTECGIGLTIDGAYPRRFHVVQAAIGAPSAITSMATWNPRQWRSNDS